MDENNNNEEIKNEVDVVNEADGIKISNDVIAVISGVAVSEVPGVYGMAGGFAGGITEVLKGKKNLAKGIKVETTDKNEVNVNVQGVNTESINGETDANEEQSENNNG